MDFYFSVGLLFLVAIQVSCADIDKKNKDGDRGRRKRGIEEEVGTLSQRRTWRGYASNATDGSDFGFAGRGVFPIVAEMNGTTKNTKNFKETNGTIAKLKPRL